MKAISDINKWANTHSNLAVDAARVLLGSFLFYKGMYLLFHFDESLQILKSIHGLAGMDYVAINKIIAGIHMLGGVMVLMGFLTRLALLVQFPLVLSAMFIHFASGANGLYSLQAGLAVVASAAFILYGSGKHSLDYILKMHA